MNQIKDISQRALEILSICEELVQKKPLNIEELFRDAQKKLNYTEKEISDTIYDLILKKLIIPDKRIVKTQVLANQKRDAIYHYITKNPGAHLREIRDKLNLQPHVTNLHLKVLENFNYIYRKKHLKYRVFFPFDFNNEYEKVILALKNETAEKIFWTIQEKGEVSPIELKMQFDGEISSKMIDYHLEPLKLSGLVLINQKDGQETLTINQDLFENVKNYLLPREVHPVAERLTVRRAFDYIGGDVRFKVVVENKSKENIKDISVQLNVKEQFAVQNTSQMVQILEPEESRGVDFTLTPLTCGKSKIHGIVSYKDAHEQTYSTELNPVLIQIKCPLVQPRILKLLEVLKLKERFQVSRAEISYIGLPKDTAFKIARDQIASLDISEIEEGGEDFSALFSGEAKVTGHPLLVDLHINGKIGIDVYMGDIKQATGFLAYIKNLINVALNYSLQISTSVEKIKNLIFNGFEFSSRLSELYAFCQNQENLDDILLLLKELQIKSESYFHDSKLTASISARFKELEQLQGKEIFARTYLNLQFDVQTWMEAVIVFAETNAKIYYESAIDQNTRNEISAGILKLREDLYRMSTAYSRKILFTLMLIHKNTGLSLFTYNFSEQELDSDLISGFLTAIQSFGKEVSKQETRMRRLSYEHFEIILADGDLTVAALTTTGHPNIQVTEAVDKFIQQFEIHYHQGLETFRGNVAQFDGTRTLVEEIFLTLSSEKNL
ncbi:MAG: hypothetical protein ACTSRC_16265 [Candidatus Helarchaeota archaeon]